MKERASCHNQKFGHSFPTRGTDCANCGINQNKLNQQLLDAKSFKNYKPKKPERGIHSEAHALAKDVSEYFNEPKKFAMYLGIIKNIGPRRAYQIFAEIKESPKKQTIKTPGKLFVYMSAYKGKKKGQNKKPRKKNANNKRAK